MPTKYTPATFQPTVRPSWCGILTYICEKEKAQILEAIIKFPEQTEIESQFWENSIKPDLEQQYQNFKRICEARGRGAQSYWGEHKLSLSITQDKHKDNSLKDKGKDKDKDKGEDKSEDKDKSNPPIDNINNKGGNSGNIGERTISHDIESIPKDNEGYPKYKYKLEQELERGNIKGTVDIVDNSEKENPPLDDFEKRKELAKKIGELAKKLPLAKYDIT